MSNLTAYIAWDADRISDRVERSVQNDQPDDIAKLSQNIKRGNEIMESWLLENDGQGLLWHGDEGYAKVPSQKLEDLEDIHQRMQEAYGDGLAFGVGLDISEAKKALDLAKKRGGSRILFYTPEVDAELRGKSDKDDKFSDLLEDQMEKADPSAGPQMPSPQMTPGNSAAGGGGFSVPMAGGESPPAAGNAAPPASPQMSASEHSQGEAAANFMDTHLASPPSATNAGGMEGDFHAAAAQGEQQDTQAEGQAGAAAGGGPPIDQLKAQIAQILMQVKKQAPVLEQLKQAAPDAYEAIVNVVKAMQLMTREVLTAPEGGEEQGEQQEPKPEPTEKSEGENRHPLAKKVALHTENVWDRISRRTVPPVEGELPDEYQGQPIEKLSQDQQGQHGGTFKLGDKILKLTTFDNDRYAQNHVKRLSKLKELNLKGVVPIHDVGIFGTNHKGETVTYEVLKRLHEPEKRITHAYRGIQQELAQHGLRYWDDHTGNLMENTLGEPQVVDLESVRPGDRGGDLMSRSPDYPDTGLGEIGGDDLGGSISKAEPKRRRSLANVRVNIGGVKGQMPQKWAGMSRRAVGGHDSGIHDSSYLLGRKHVLKIMEHHSREAAEQYLKRLERLRDLKLSHLTPIHDFGHFAYQKATDAFSMPTFLTYEVMKRAHKAPWHEHDGKHWYDAMMHDDDMDENELEGFRDAKETVQDELMSQGLYHTDSHPGNIMQNTNMDPVAIDLESVDANPDAEDTDLPTPWQGEDERWNSVARARRKLNKSLAGLRVKMPSITGGPMPESQVPPSGRTHAMLPAGSEIIEHRGKREQRKLKVLHIDPNGKEQTKHRQMDSGQATPDNPQEAIAGRIHPISTLAPKD